MVICGPAELAAGVLGQGEGELTRHGVIVSPRVGSTRFSMHFYNSSDDIDRALAILGQVLA